MDGSELVLTECQSDVPADTTGAERLSFDQAFVIHHRVVYRYACGLTRDQALAEDVAQEVFIRLYKNLDAAQRNGLLRPWLLRVTANLVRNTLRGRRRAQVRDETFATLTDASSVESPDKSLLHDCEIAEARRALGKIAEPMRSCILLKHEGLSYREIAGTLGINENSVGSLIARARREFIRLYGKIGKKQ